MTALTKNKPAPERDGKGFSDPVAAGVRIYSGALVALDASGNAIPAIPAAPVMRGVAFGEANNTDGTAGDIAVATRNGTFRFAQTGLDRADIGSDVYVVDDATVGAAGTLVAGKLVDLDAAGAWIKIA